MPRARALQFSLFFGVATVLVLTGCGRGSRPSVLLLTLDTTRSDRLGCYGYLAAETPALDALAAQGIRFTEAYCHAPLTLPSHATILTGLLPPEHGLHDNGRGRLSENVPTLAKILKKSGYATAAFLASFVLDRQFGLDQGFDVYDDRMTPTTDSGPMERENRADVVAERALAWLAKQNRSRPFFCWVHFFDPHAPYEPPEPYRSRHADPYDGEIAFMDAQISKILHLLETRNLLHNTLVIAVGDHGESFGEHGEFGHGNFLYDTTMRVPLIVSLPGRLPAGTVEGRLVGLTDIARTILDQCGIKLPRQIGGENLLAPSKFPSDNRELYGETEFLFNSFGWAPLYSLTTPRWKYIQCPQEELYDRQNDLREEHNLASENQQLVKSLSQRLVNLRRTMRVYPASLVKLTPQAVSKLRSLGYLAGSSDQTRPEPDRQSLRDPKAMLPIYETCRKAEALIKDNNHERAIAVLAPLVSESPESRKIHELLTFAYVELGRFEEAKPHIDYCLKLEPTDRAMLCNRATVLLAEGRLDEAEEVLRATLVLPRNPREPLLPLSDISTVDVELSVKLGLVLLKQGRTDEAAREFSNALKYEPSNLRAIEGLANIRVLEGKPAEAVELYKKILALAPHALEVRRSLGYLLTQQGEYAEALRTWRDGLKFHREDPVLLGNLAWWLATCPEASVRDGKEAVRLALAAVKSTHGENFQTFDILAAACAEAGDFTNAVVNLEKGIALARSQKAPAELVKEMEKRRELFVMHQPYRQPRKK
ncbi:MAG: sulfatase-like hydrolase/transferase [Kiritimatiellae bacterium]|nr:sulfatase-like hydrolase/transferase [Kiritimatiellia bacterium]